MPAEACISQAIFCLMKAFQSLWSINSYLIFHSSASLFSFWAASAICFKCYSLNSLFVIEFSLFLIDLFIFWIHFVLSFCWVSMVFINPLRTFLAWRYFSRAFQFFSFSSERMNSWFLSAFSRASFYFWYSSRSHFILAFMWE